MRLVLLTLCALLALSQVSAYIHKPNYYYNQNYYQPNQQQNPSYPQVRQQKPSYFLKYEWKKLELGFPDEQTRQQAEADGNLLPINSRPIDVHHHYGTGRTFVTMPRFQQGTPYSLAVVSNETTANGNLLQPYPSYEMHNNRNGTNCDAITSVFRVAITECDQMWIMDTGSILSKWQCPPQLILIDLKTDEIIHRYRFDASIYTPGASLFTNTLANVKNPAPTGDCSNTMLYIADNHNHGLIVYDYQQNSSWRIENRFMYPDPNYGLHTIAGQSFMLMDGIYALATDKKNLYFHPLASATEYFVPLSVIENRTLFANNKGNRHEDFKPLGQRPSECGSSAMDKNNNLYCVLFNPVKLIMWNVNTPYNSRNFKYLNVDSNVLELVGGMKVVENEDGLEELWMISNSGQKGEKRNFDEVNFRVVVLPLANIAATLPSEYNGWDKNDEYNRWTNYYNQYIGWNNRYGNNGWINFNYWQ